VTLDHIEPMSLLSLVHILVCMLYFCYLSLILLGFGVHTWLVMLSHAVLSVIQVFPSFVMLGLACVFVRVLWSPIRRDAS
jgi:predicted HAD superfamily Cof-like phosphohydrolase